VKEKRPLRVLCFFSLIQTNNLHVQMRGLGVYPQECVQYVIVHALGYIR